MVNWFFQFGILLGTSLLLIVAVAWVALIDLVRAKYPIIPNPLGSQIFYVVCITIIGFLFLAIFDPFGSSNSTLPTGAEKIVDVDETMRIPFLIK